MSKYDPKRTSYARHPIAVTPEERAQAMWLLRKYTSITYIRRMSTLFANFVGGYDEFAQKANGPRVSFYRDNLASFYSYRASLAEGLEQLERGYTIGYRSIREGCFFVDELDGPRFEHGLENEEIGFVWGGQPRGLYAWADIAMTLGARVSLTLGAEWAFPQIVLPYFVGRPLPAGLPPEPATGLGAKVRTGEDVPASGIWRPVGMSDGCPNYLWAGRTAPPAHRASERFDYPAHPEGSSRMIQAHTSFDYVRVPTQWELLWEDRRYDGGRAPAADEEQFLDEDTEPPPWPPIAERPPVAR